MANNKNCGAVLVIMLGTVVMMLRISSADPDMLQDVCVADFNSPLKVNGYACKSKATSNDFFYHGLAKPKRTGNTTVTPANVLMVPGLNTLGISLSRVDLLPGAVNPPHTHPRATEIMFILQGELEVGFVTTANELIWRTIYTGDLFVFPKGLLHYQRNPSKSNTTIAIAAFNSQLPGTQSIASSLFPGVPDAVLADAFRIDATTVKTIKAKFPAPPKK